ncbi:unnamed protein product [Euphydryas editha]|uniref:Uncharacterized protein n=1 Tax=Euphydryas editha TaxID=104508 RepID=A0AAU9TJ58_EUPED|nr:unnamed protein product [Euphydryas editha]
MQSVVATAKARPSILTVVGHGSETGRAAASDVASAGAAGGLSPDATADNDDGPGLRADRRPRPRCCATAAHYCGPCLACTEFNFGYTTINTN